MRSGISDEHARSPDADSLPRRRLAPLRVAAVASGLTLALLFAAFQVGGNEPTSSEPGVFFPTWKAEGAVPLAIVAGVLIKRDGCLLLDKGDHLVMPLWEDDHHFQDGAVRDASGKEVVRQGEALSGGGGYGSDCAHAEGITGKRFRHAADPGGRNRMP